MKIEFRNMSSIKKLWPVIVIIIIAIWPIKVYYQYLFGWIVSTTSTTSSEPAYNEELATILKQIRVSTTTAFALAIPAGDFNIREWRYWNDATSKAIVVEILKSYGSITDLSPNPDVSGRTDLPRPSDPFVFSHFDVDQYDLAAGGRFQTVRDNYGNMLEISIPFVNSYPDCPNVWAKLNGLRIELSTKTITTGTLTCGFPTSSPSPTPTSSSELKVFYDSFEAGEWKGLWTEDPQNDWFISKQRSVDGRRSAEVDGLADNASITSVPVNLQGKNNVNITFSWFIENGLDLGEYLAFDVSTDNGASWVEKAKLSGNVSPENVWQAQSINLTNISNLKIRFRGKMSDASEDADVDLVKIMAY